MNAEPRPVYIVNPPSPPGMTASRDAAGGFGTVISDKVGPSYPVLDVAYAAAVLTRSGVPTKVVDAVALDESAEDIAGAILDDSARLVFIRTSTPTYDVDLLSARRIKQATGATVILFGPHVSFVPDSLLPTDSADGMIRGEPEYSIAMMAGESDWSRVPGLVFKRGDSVVRGPAPELIADLDGLPFPAWELTPYEKYILDDLSDGSRYLTVLSSRGCFYNCGYCPYPVSQGTRMRTRSVRNVVDELAYLEERFEAPYVIFRDPLFTSNLNRTRELCRSLVASGLATKWRCETRAELLPSDLLAEMAAAGCRGVNIGIETVRGDALGAVNRKVASWERYREVFAACKELGIATFAFFLIGLPGETKESFIESVEFAEELAPDAIQFSVIAPYPGTTVSAWASVGGSPTRTQRPVENFTENATVSTPTLTAQEMDDLKTLAEARVGSSWKPALRQKTRAQQA